MLAKITGEVREIVWLASVIGGLSVVGISLAIAAVIVLERVSTHAQI